MSKILVTGCAGFIGSNLTDRLLERGYTVVGIDNFSDFYDPLIKERNLKQATTHRNFSLERADICDLNSIGKIFADFGPEVVVHLAAQAGVRPSIINPELYAKINVSGSINLLTLAVNGKVDKFIFGSSSSVYGNSPILPFDEKDNCNWIISPYGASKRSAEFFVESFFSNFGLKSTILRFFTVYGKRNRPDMAVGLFTKAISEGKPINLFDNGEIARDYTYVDDIVTGIIAAIETNLEFEIINLGNSKPVTTKEVVNIIAEAVGRKAIINLAPAAEGDVKLTFAKIAKAKSLLGWEPKVNIKEGIGSYVRWYKNVL